MLVEITGHFEGGRLHFGKEECTELGLFMGQCLKIGVLSTVK